jgi:[histone H3]-trimethyl-L-lysine4 demethylase
MINFLTSFVSLCSLLSSATPWLYVGMLFSSFCWHAEDSYLLSMNYLHCGASKSWYAAPGTQALHIQAAMKHRYPSLFAQQPDAHHSLTLQMSPHLLHSQYGIDICHTIQQAGEFICTFPAAYHCGFSHGFNVGEAVNFAISQWLPFGRQAQHIDRQHAHTQCFSFQQLIVKLATTRVQTIKREDDLNQSNLKKDTAADVLSDDALLLHELDILLADEQRDRTACLSAGITRFTSLSSSNVNVPLCSICNVYCYLSSVSCDRCHLPTVCLQHAEYGCTCPTCSRVEVQYRFTIQHLVNLRDALTKVVKRDVV